MVGLHKIRVIKKYLPLILALFLGLGSPFGILAQTPSSTNYRLEDAQFDAGGGLSTSTNYQNRGALGAEGDTVTSSTNFSLFPGFELPAYPGVPGQPKFVNTGGALYNWLDFAISTGGNAADAAYAVAISSDNFATTNYVQANDTVAATTSWQSYINWGSGVGQRITGLTPNTSYQIKVKARFGKNSETAFSLPASAATITPNLTVVVEGVASNTAIGSFTTNVNSSATSVPFGILQTGSIKIAAQKITVSTNAVAGYTTALQQDSDLVKSNGTQIPAVIAGNANPSPWPSGITHGRFGYHTTDGSLCLGIANRFASPSDDTFAAATSTPYEVSCNTGPVANEIINIVFMYLK